MSSIEETAMQIETRINHLTSAQTHFASAEQEANQAALGSEEAAKAINAVRQGIQQYSENTEKALISGEEADSKLKLSVAILQDPVGYSRWNSVESHLETANKASQLAAKKRDHAILAGTVAVQHLYTAKKGVIGFLSHTDSARTHTTHTTDELNNTRSVSKSPSPMDETIGKAQIATEQYGTILGRAFLDTIRHIGASYDAPHAEIAAEIFATATKDLEEGIALLEESKNKPIEDFLSAAQAALEKVDRDFGELLAGLQLSTRQSAKVFQTTLKEDGPLPLIHEAIQENKALLAKL